MWRDFTFKERYSGWRELRRYFDYVVEKWNIQKDISFNKAVEGATFDEEKALWHIDCADGSSTYARWFIPCLGFAARRFTPSMTGMSDFQGEIYHTGNYPAWGVKLKGKRVAVIGTGATGIQTIQEVAPIAKQLTVYQRTPNLCLPMDQAPLDPEEEERRKNNGDYAKAFNDSYATFAGFTYSFVDRKTFDDNDQQRKEFYDSLWQKRGFAFWLGNYS